MPLIPDIDDTAAARLRKALANHLEAAGWLRTQAWREAAESVPRHLFVPAFYRSVETPRETIWEPVTAASVGVNAWLEMAYENTTWVTQLDNTPANWSNPQPVPGGNPTSSSSLPSLVVDMLESLDVADGHRVLEIGTGTGYSTALLCHRLGDHNVTSIEVDPHVAAQARQALDAAGYRPNLVVGDGLQGHEPCGPYDRIIATCAVSSIPQAWLTQCRAGGTILATLSGWLLGSGLARLKVAGDGRAHGRFLPGMISFMLARPHAPPTLVLQAELFEPPGEERPTELDPAVLDDFAPRLIATLAAPRVIQCGDVFGDPTTDDYAAVAITGGGTWTVGQGGRRRIWDDIEAAISTWREAGEPWIDQLTVDITPEQQTVRLDVDGVHASWRLPEP